MSSLMIFTFGWSQYSKISINPGSPLSNALICWSMSRGSPLSNATKAETTFDPGHHLNLWRLQTRGTRSFELSGD